MGGHEFFIKNWGGHAGMTGGHHDYAAGRVKPSIGGRGLIPSLSKPLQKGMFWGALGFPLIYVWHLVMGSKGAPAAPMQRFNRSPWAAGAYQPHLSHKTWTVKDGWIAKTPNHEQGPGGH
eukprot:Hpha_TRINITY_DN16367_c0_g1::TRINITY_DN16367_c0_g1_i1::g.62865::m.62865